MRICASLRSAILALGPWGLLLGWTSPETPPTTPQLYFFTTPEAEGGPEGAKRAMRFVSDHAGEIRLRPVLLASDFRALRTVTEECPLYRTVKALEVDGKPGALAIPLYDEEGLRLAERWEVKRVPAFVLVRKVQAHATAGAAANLEQLWECSK